MITVKDINRVLPVVAETPPTCRVKGMMFHKPKKGVESVCAVSAILRELGFRDDVIHNFADDQVGKFWTQSAYDKLEKFMDDWDNEGHWPGEKKGKVSA